MSANRTSYVYIRSEPGLWTVGFYAGEKWHPDSDYSTREAAAERVHWLNGGGYDIVQERERELVHVLQLAYALRPLLLKEQGYVPECVLNVTNAARAVLDKVR